jgi:hypothetical protein
VVKVTTQNSPKSKIKRHGANMIYHLAMVLLAPVLAAQGMYVRRVTPSLSEPEGVRSGVFGAGPKIKLLIVGDSAAAGLGAATQHQAHQAG